MRRNLLLPVLLSAGLALAACGSDDSSSSDTQAVVPAATDVPVATEAPAPTDAPEATSAPTTAEADASSSEATIAVATDAALGDFLVDGQGRTVYLFEADSGTTTACTGDCATNWPPVIADGAPTGGDGVDAAELGTADGIEPNQVTYNGHLLYYFIGDSAPGDTNGVGIPAWYAVDPNGDAIEAS
jgi:predicted lipoprotein with Yx(FWY)xxD motif